MKKYVILTNSTHICGWTLYSAKKLEYVKSIGWNPFAIAYFDGKERATCNALHYDKLLVAKEIVSYPACLSKKALCRLFKNIRNYISYSSNDEIVVESTSDWLGIWGELIARDLNAKHFILLTHSYVKPASKEMAEFFYFKYLRGEVAAIHDHIIHDLLVNFYNVPIEQKNVLRCAAFSPAINDGKDYVTLFNLKSYDQVIAYIGNLDKLNVLGIIDQVSQYARLKAEKGILCVVIGSSSNGDIEQKLLRNTYPVQNLKIQLCGTLYPMPSNLLEEFDVTIASFGSSVHTAMIGKCTIRMANDYSCDVAGVMGYDFIDADLLSISGKFTGGHPLVEVIDQCLNGEIKEKYQKIDFVDNSKQHLDKHMAFVSKSDATREYYTVEQIKRKKTVVSRVLLSTLGINLYTSLKNIAKNITRKKG